MAAVEGEPEPGGGAAQDLRVQAASRREVLEQLEKYGHLLETVLDGQAELAPETRRVLLQEQQENFKAAVQVNVLVSGQPWDEAPEVEEAVDLDSLLDDTIVETTRRRRVYPKQILPHVVHSLKAERKLLELYEPAVKAQELLRDPDQESIMNDLSGAAPGMMKQAIQVIKSLNTLKHQAEGLCEVLNMKPSQASLEIHQEVFGSDSQSDAPSPPGQNRQPIKRAAEDAAAADGYVPLRKKPDEQR